MHARFAIGFVELLADDHVAAEHELRSACEALHEKDNRFMTSATAALLSEVLYRSGKLDEAEGFAQLSVGLVSEGNAYSHALARGVQAKIRGARGHVREAQQLAASAVGIAETSDNAWLIGQALLDQSEVLRQSQNNTDAISAAQRALRIYENKGFAILADTARSLVQSAATRA
jgi:ATP/maltotriose-dependent transcriptional regulator MalT